MPSNGTMDAYNLTDYPYMYFVITVTFTPPDEEGENELDW